MKLTPIIICELNNKRVAIYKDNDGNYFVTNTATEKSLLCIGIDEAIDIFDFWVETTFGAGNNLLS